MDDKFLNNAANDGAIDSIRLYSRKTDLKAALLARRLQRERLDRAIEELLRTPANEQNNFYDND